MNETVRIAIGEEIARVTICRPQALNALNHEVRVALADAFRELAADPSVKAVILEGEGRSFCAGQDQKESAKFDAEHAARRIHEYGDLFEAMRALPQPSVAKIHGYAVGAGLQIALLCDLRVAAESARVGLPELNVGSACITGSALLWPIAGEAAVKRLVLLAEFVPATEARALHIVHEVVPDDELESRIREVALGLASRPVSAVRLTKVWWRLITEDLFQRGLDQAHEAHAANFRAGGLSQGAQSFVARRGS